MDQCTPLLGDSNNTAGSSTPEASSQTRSGLPKILDFLWGGVYAPDASTYDPIEILLNAPEGEEKDKLTERWRDNRLNELSFVGVVAALLAGVLTSTGSWPDILPNGRQSPWPVRTSWYCGIILSLFSILTAADQTVRLYRLSSHRDGYRNIRKLLAKSNGGGKKVNGGGRGRDRGSGRLRPSTAQIYTWQMPVMFLTTATLCMIVGMFLHVWSATKLVEHKDRWDPDSKVAITFTVVAAISICMFFAGQVTLYAPQEEME